MIEAMGGFWQALLASMGFTVFLILTIVSAIRCISGFIDSRPASREDRLAAAARIAIEAICTEHLFQTGQFSRQENPPKDYPPRGSTHISLYEAANALREALKQQ